MSWLKTLLQVFFVRSLEPFFCPCCQFSEKKVIGSRNRSIIESDSNVIIFRIRRLRCKACQKIHHELPDKVLPYKRHEVKSIEEVLDETPLLSITADGPTIRRWKSWFNGLACHFLGALSSALLKGRGKTEKTPFIGTALQRIQFYVGNAPGWLSRVVQSVVKNNCWVQTRSAYSAK